MSSSYPTIHITTILRLGTNKFTQLFRNFPQHACNKRCLVLNIRKYPRSLQTTWLDTLNKNAEFIKNFHNRLARSLSILINTIDPDAIVFGGGVSNEIKELDNIKEMSFNFAGKKKYSNTFFKSKIWWCKWG